MNLRKAFSYLCLLTAFLSLGGIRKNEDPVAATAQTAAISYQQKSEETKDGVKGAPTPSMTFYPNQKFLTNSPVKESKPEEISEENPQEPVEGELSGEDELWEADTEAVAKEGQESAENAVEDGDDWWSEEDETPPEDGQSEGGF